MTAQPIALIAEDEPLLAAALQAELAQLWPELRIVAVVGDGVSAVHQSLALQPDLLFFDIRMPGMSGLEAAAELADQWDTATRPFPALVFVTAYDEYAVQAFEAQAVDYLLKPVQSARLQKTMDKLRARWSQASVYAAPAPSFDATLGQLRALLETASAATPHTRLKHVQVSVGSSIRMVAVEEVLYFEAADKYVRVLTGNHEYLIRTPLKDLLPQLDPEQFWQIHRGTVVNSSVIDSVSRDEAGKLSLSLRGSKDKLAVSRLYAHRFKAM